VKGIQVCSKKGVSPSPRGDNSERLKIQRIFFENLLQNQKAKNGTYYPWVKGIQVCLIKGPGPIERGDNCKNGVGSFKNLILKNYEARKAEFYMKAL
jgi:hypothetical protein